MDFPIVNIKLGKLVKANPANGANNLLCIVLVLGVFLLGLWFVSA